MKYIFTFFAALLALHATASNKYHVRLDSLINYTIEKKLFNGSVIVARNNKILYKKDHGYKDATCAAKIDEGTAFYLASISKSITATCILQLIEKGTLSFEDKLNGFFPDFPDNEITIRDLLQHTSGIEDHITEIYLPLWQKQNIPDSLRKINSNDEAIRHMIKNYTGHHFKAGTKHEYLNTNYMLLASIVEKVSGKPFKNYLHKNIFTPCKMSNSYLYMEDTIPNKAEGFKTDYLEGKTRVNDLGILNGVYGDGGIYTSSLDLLNFTDRFFRGQIVSPAMVSEATTSRDLAYGPPYIYAGLSVLVLGFVCLLMAGSRSWMTAISAILLIGGTTCTWIGFNFKKNDNTQYGMGWSLTKHNREDVAYHSGGWGGWRNILWHEKSGLTIILLTNNTICPYFDLTRNISNIMHDRPFEYPAIPVSAMNNEPGGPNPFEQREGSNFLKIPSLPSLIQPGRLKDLIFSESLGSMNRDRQTPYMLNNEACYAYRMEQKLSWPKNAAKSRSLRTI